MKKLLALVTLAACSQAFAAYTVNITQVGPDVVATGSGSINTNGLGVANLTVSTTIMSAVRATDAVLGLHAPGSQPLRYWSGVLAGPTSVGTGARTDANSGTGDAVQVNGQLNGLSVPRTYVSGAALNSSATWNATTIANLGLTPGTYTWTWGSGPNADSYVLNISAPAPMPVPTLSEWALIAFASLIVGLGVYQQRRCQS